MRLLLCVIYFGLAFLINARPPVPGLVPIVQHDQFSREVHPKVRLLSDVGVFFYQKGLYRDAVAYFNLAVALDPRSLNALINRSATYIKMKRYPEAIEDGLRVLEFTPNSIQAYNNLGNAYTALGQKRLALRNYKAAYRLDKNYYEVIFNIANFYYRFNMKIDAIRYYKRVILLKPDLVEAYIFKAVALYDLGYRKSARAEFKRVLQMGAHNNTELRLTLAQALLQTKNYFQAENILTRMIEENAMESEAYVMRAKVRYQVKNYYDAYTDMESAFKIRRDVEHFDFYYKLKNKLKNKH